MVHKKPNTLTLSVKVYSPKKTYFNGQAVAVSATNKTGSFDILPLHHNFITLVTPCDVTIRTAQGELVIIPVEKSLLHATNDKITIFLDV